MRILTTYQLLSSIVDANGCALIPDITFQRHLLQRHLLELLRIIDD